MPVRMGKYLLDFASCLLLHDEGKTKCHSRLCLHIVYAINELVIMCLTYFCSDSNSLRFKHMLMLIQRQRNVDIWK